MTASRTTSQPSFYVTGGSLRRDAQSYVVRQADSLLYEGISHGEFCYVLTARQMGKSSLMVQVAARLREEGAGVAVLDLTAVGQNVTAEQWYGGLMTQMAQQLELEDEMFDFWHSHLDLGPLQRWKQAIEKVTLPRYTASVVIFVDEIDAVRSLPFSTDEFFAGIREFYNRRTENEDLQRLAFCLLGVATPSDLIRDTRTTPFNIGRRIELHDFTEAEAAPLARGLGCDEQAGALLLRRVLYWTGGHPYLTQRLCQAVAENSEADTAQDVDRVCEEMFLSSRARERDDNLLFVRERMMRSEVDLAGLLTLYEQSLRGKRVRDDEANLLVSVLRLSGIVRAEAGLLKMRNRIYGRVFDREWVKSSMPDAEVRRQKEAYRRGLLRAAAVATVILIVMAALVAVAVRSAQAARASQLEADTQRIEAENQRSRAEAALEEARAQRGRAEVALAEAQRQQGLAEKNARREAEQRKIADQERDRANKNLSLAESNAQKMQAALAEANQQRKQAEEQRVLAEERDRSNHKLLYAAAMNQAQEDWESANIKRMQELLDASVSKPGQEDLRGFEWYHLWRLCYADLYTLHHAGVLYSVAISPDGKVIASGSNDGTVKLWDSISKEPLRQIKAHERDVNAVAFSPDGKTLATGGSDHTVKLWDVATGRHKKTLSYASGVFSVTFSPNSKFLASGCTDGTIWLWDAEAGRETPIGTLSGRVYAVAFSPDGQTLAAGGVNQFVRLWNCVTREPLPNIDAWSGRVVYSDVGSNRAIYSVTFSRDGRKLATGGNDHSVRVWDIAARTEDSSIHAHPTVGTSVAFSPDGNSIAVGGRDRTVKLWDVSSQQPRVTFKGHMAGINSVAFSADGKMLATAGGDGVVKLWNPQERTVVAHNVGRILAVAFSADGETLATANSSGTAKVWDVESGREVKTIEARIRQITSAAISPDGKKLAFGARDGSLRVWDVTTGRELRRIENHEGAVRSLAFSPDGEKLASSGITDRTIKVWEISTGRRLASLTRQNTVIALAFSPDGKRLASGGNDRVVRLWDTSSWQESRIGRHDDSVYSLAFSPDGKYLASGSHDGSVKLWDVFEKQLIETLNGHTETVYSIVFSHDGKRLTTASSATAKLWDMETKQERITLKGHTALIYSLAFSPDGRKLASAGNDNTVRLWRAATDEEVRARNK